jgi:hypothetical protein
MTQEKQGISRATLDRAGASVLRAAALPDSESDEICAAAPQLFGRIRSRIAIERLNSERKILASFWSISKRAIPAMMLMAAISFGLSAYMTGNKTQPTAFSVDAYLGTNESGIENMVFAERRPLTNDEVLATIISRDEREASK